MADAPGGLLLEQVGHDAVRGVQVLVDVHLAHVVDEVEVEVARAGLLELALEDLGHLVHIGQVVAGELGREIVALARVARQRRAHGELGVAAMIAPCRIVVVDALLHGVIDHLVHGILIDPRVVAVHDRQAHGAKAERGELQVLELLVQHTRLRSSVRMVRRMRPGDRAPARPW